MLNAIIGAALGQQNQRKQSRQNLLFSALDVGYNEYQYNRQKKDNIEFWRMQNEYNAPSAQMERLRDAGLNPNLVYGRGAGAVGEAGPIRPPDKPAGRIPESIQRENAMHTYYDFQIKGAQLDNLKAQNTVLQEDALYRQAQTLDTLTSASRKKFDLGIEQALEETTLEFRREMLRQKSAETDVLLRRDEREAAMNASSISEAYQRIQNMRSQKVVTDVDAALKQLDYELYRDYGIRPHDPYWTRILADILEKNPQTKEQIQKIIDRLTTPIWKKPQRRFKIW